MTVLELAKAAGFELLCGEESLSREVRGGYVCDLLSWVMGRAPQDGAWITIMSNVNVAAVALLADLACVILCENVQPDPELLERARQQDIPLLRSPRSSYETACTLHALIERKEAD